MQAEAEVTAESMMGIKRISLTLLAVLLTSISTGSMAYAGESSTSTTGKSVTLVSIPVDNEIHDEPGSQVEITTQLAGPIDGQMCKVDFSFENNTSIHSDNTILLYSGESMARFDGVEDADFAERLATMQPQYLYIDGYITVQMILGEEGVSSGGIIVDLYCEVLPPAEIGTPVSVVRQIGDYTPDIVVTPTVSSVPAAAIPASPRFTG